MSTLDCNGRMLFVAEAHRRGEQRFIVRAAEKVDRWHESSLQLYRSGILNVQSMLVIFVEQHFVQASPLIRLHE